MPNALDVQDLRASIGDLQILNGVDLEVPFGEVHAVMGPNGSGKSTLCHVLMGSEEYDASGDARVGGVEIMGMTVDARARAGLFEAFQYPTEVPGVSLDDLTAAMAASNPQDGGYEARTDSASDRLSSAFWRDEMLFSSTS